MLDDVLCDNAVGFGDQFDGVTAVRIVEGVGDLAQTIEARLRGLS
jgi:hypothetical protein